MKFLPKLATLAQVNATRRATPKSATPTRKAVKAKAVRTERAVKVDVRAACVARDGNCRLARRPILLGDTFGSIATPVRCSGLSEWAHLGEKRRSKTRGQPPEVRHTTVDSLMLCRLHHAQYDGRARPRLTIHRLSTRGADGPLAFTQEKA